MAAWKSSRCSLVCLSGAHAGYAGRRIVPTTMRPTTVESIDRGQEGGHHVATSLRGSAVRTIGVRQLKNEATQIIRAVREQNAQFVVTVNGQPVATLRPYSDRDVAGLHRSQAAAEIAAIDRLALDVGNLWDEPKG